MLQQENKEFWTQQENNQAVLALPSSTQMFLINDDLVDSFCNLSSAFL